MQGVALKLLVVNAEYYGEPTERTSLPRELVVTASLDEQLVAAVRRALPDVQGSRLWSIFLEPDSEFGLWVLPVEATLNGERLRTDSVGHCLVDPSLTVRSFVEYFGNWAVGPSATLAVYPAEGIGGGPLEPWVDLGEAVLEYVGSQGLRGVANDVLSLYGAAQLSGSVRRRIADHRARGLRREAALWLHKSQVTRRVAKAVDRRARWNCAELAVLLDIDNGTAGRLLAARGFVLSEHDLRYWERKAG